MLTRLFQSLLVCLLVLSKLVSAAPDSLNHPQLGVSDEKRVALVIGNSAYKDAPLNNPVNDARDMAAALRMLGFDVIEKTNVTQKEMNRAIVQFGEKLRADTIALFYYAGHGMQVKGKNYLIPIDAQIHSEASVRVETVDIDGVLDQLMVSPLNIVVLDACRNNPFERRFRSFGGGLAQMDAPKGSLIAYATAPGKTAADGENRNGLYTQELLKHIQTPGLPLETVFKRVRVGVMRASGETQTPWETSSLTGEFFFRPVAGAPSPTMQEAALNEHKAEAVESQRFAEKAAIPIDLSGTWTPEHVPSGEVYIFPDGTCTYKGFLIVTIGGKWNRTDPEKREFTIVWNHGFTDVLTLSEDGSRLMGKNNVGDPVSFVRKK